MEIFSKMIKVYISVGSNLGDRITNCCKGIFKIVENKHFSIVNCSSFYLTSPTDYEAQNWFVNAVIKIKTILTPYELLKNLISIQNIFGRKINNFRFGPRVLDLDIIFYGDKILHSPGLEIPHPRMQNRFFVLKPLCDIDPDFIHPVLKVTVQSILDNMKKNSQKIISLEELLENKNFKQT